MTKTNPSDVPGVPQDTSLELYGPDDGDWYTTRIHDWIALCPALQDVDIRVYVILRALVLEKFKNPVRKLTLTVLCQLVPGPNGKPSGLTRIRGSLKRLSGVGLLVTPEGGPIKTSSRAGAGQKMMRIRINDMPAEGYPGWRNAETKLSSINSLMEVQEAGRNSDPHAEGDALGEGPGRNSDPAGCNSDPRGRFSDPHPGGEQPERELPLVPSVGTSSGGDALSARSAGDGRRPSDRSSVREAEGGCAASSKTDSSPTSEVPTARAQTGSSKARHTREHLDLARQVAAAYPEELGVRLVPVLTDAILHALAGDVPGSDRTVGQLGARIQQRWNHHGYAAAFYAGKLTTPIGAAVEMVRPLKTTDRYGCGNPRCEVGTDVDTGADCLICPERLADRRRARRKDGDTVPGQRAEPPGRLQWECGSTTCRKAVRGPRTASGLCPGCEAELERAAAHLQPERPAGSALAPAAPSGVPSETGVDEETARLRAMYARQYGSPEQVEAYCANAPF